MFRYVFCIPVLSKTLSMKRLLYGKEQYKWDKTAAYRLGKDLDQPFGRRLISKIYEKKSILDTNDPNKPV